MDTLQARTDVPATEQSKASRVTFRVVAILVTLWLLALNVFGLLEVFFMWLPAETVAEMLEEEASFIDVHRSHFMAIGVIAWAVVLSMLVQVRKPERRRASMLFLGTIALCGTVLFGLSGTLGDWLIEEIAMVLIPVGLVFFLHPSRDQMLSNPTFDRTMVSAATVAAVPWAVYIADNAWAQLNSVARDAHGEMEHWALAALLGAVIVVSAFLGSSQHTGWRLQGWLAAAASVIFAAHSLAYPGVASALPVFWAVAAIVWGIGFAVMIVRRSGRVTGAPSAA